MDNELPETLLRLVVQVVDTEKNRAAMGKLIEAMGKTGLHFEERPSVMKLECVYPGIFESGGTAGMWMKWDMVKPEQTETKP